MYIYIYTYIQGRINHFKTGVADAKHPKFFFATPVKRLRHPLLLDKLKFFCYPGEKSSPPPFSPPNRPTNQLTDGHQGTQDQPTYRQTDIRVQREVTLPIMYL